MTPWVLLGPTFPEHINGLAIPRNVAPPKNRPQPRNMNLTPECIPRTLVDPAAAKLIRLLLKLMALELVRLRKLRTCNSADPLEFEGLTIAIIPR